MEEIDEKLEISVSLDRKTVTNIISQLYDTLGLVLPEDEKEVDKLMITYAKNICENLGKYNIENGFESAIKKDIAMGNLIRERGQILGESLWIKEYTLAQDPLTWLRKVEKNKNMDNWSYMFLKYKDRNLDKGDENEKEQKEQFIKISIETYDNPLMIDCTEITQECFPIELIKALGLQMDELEKYSLTITQIEQLIMAKRIYKHQDERDIRCTSPLIFFVKWLNDEICLLRASYSEYNKTWHYSVDHFNNIKGYPRAIKKDSKMLMPSPSDKELLLDLKKDKSEGYIKKKKNVRKINPLNKKK